MRLILCSFGFGFGATLLAIAISGVSHLYDVIDPICSNYPHGWPGRQIRLDLQATIRLFEEAKARGRASARECEDSLLFLELRDLIKLHRCSREEQIQLRERVSWKNAQRSERRQEILLNQVSREIGDTESVEQIRNFVGNLMLKHVKMSNSKRVVKAARSIVASLLAMGVKDKDGYEIDLLGLSASKVTWDSRDYQSFVVVPESQNIYLVGVESLSEVSGPARLVPGNGVEHADDVLDRIAFRCLYFKNGSFEVSRRMAKKMMDSADSDLKDLMRNALKIEKSYLVDKWNGKTYYLGELLQAFKKATGAHGRQIRFFWIICQSLESK